MVFERIVSDPLSEGPENPPYEDLNIATKIGANSFFHTKINRSEAEKLLVNPGDFLMRIPKKKDMICLSVLDDGYNHHHLLLDSSDIAVVRHSFDNCHAFNMKGVGNQVLRRPVFV